MMMLNNSSYFRLIYKIQGDYIVDIFLTDKDDKSLIDYICKEDMLHDYYSINCEMNPHKLPLLLTRIYERDFEDFNYLLDNNVVSIKDKDDIISITKWKIFLNTEYINFDKIEGIDDLLLKTVLLDIDFSDRLQFRRIQLFFKTYKEYLGKPCETIIKELKITHLMYKGLNLLKHNEDLRYIIHNICIFGFRDLFDMYYNEGYPLNMLDIYGNSVRSICKGGRNMYDCFI